MVTRFLEWLGRFVLRRLEEFGTIVLLYVETMRQLKHKPRIRHIIAQMSHLGVDSLSIVSLTLLFTGVVLTLQWLLLPSGGSLGPSWWGLSVRDAWGLPSRQRSAR